MVPYLKINSCTILKYLLLGNFCLHYVYAVPLYKPTAINIALYIYLKPDENNYVLLCMIKIFRGAGVVTPSKPPLPTNNFCLYPPPVLRCFWQDPLMIPPPPTTPLQASFTATPSPSTTPSLLKILIIHIVKFQQEMSKCCKAEVTISVSRQTDEFLLGLEIG